MKYYCNPLNVPYLFETRNTSSEGKVRVHRTAADASLIRFKGRYYIFATAALGVWVSDDLVSWERHPLPEGLPVDEAAPDARVMNGYVYYCFSGRGICDRWRTKDILNGPYEKISGTFDYWDPNLFADDDGRVYFYWGSSDVTPIWGVELDPETMIPKGERIALVSAHPDQIGFERFGEDNPVLPEKGTYMEGVWVDKFGGKYYLQYAAPGTEFNVYCDGVYVSDKPLGPYVPAGNNPFSYKPGGYFPGAGHGSTMEDMAGNLWHVSTMRISVNDLFERRVGLWPAGIDADGELCCNQRYGDWPVSVSGENQDMWRDPEWMLLSSGKSVSASSFTKGHEPDLASREDVRTWWQAGSASREEWIKIDLGEAFEVHAVQINFADGAEDIRLPGESAGETCPGGRFTQWKLEASSDGMDWFTVCDKSDAETDLSHDLLVSEEGYRARFFRLSDMAVPFGRRPCISGLRVFGKGDGPAPKVPTFKAVRTGDLDMEVTITGQDDATGYNILFGASEDKLYHSWMVFNPGTLRIGALMKGRKYAVRVDAFNENGITEGKVLKELV